MIANQQIALLEGINLPVIKNFHENTTLFQTVPCYLSNLNLDTNSIIQGKVSSEHLNELARQMRNYLDEIFFQKLHFNQNIKFNIFRQLEEKRPEEIKELIELSKEPSFWQKYCHTFGFAMTHYRESYKGGDEFIEKYKKSFNEKYGKGVFYRENGLNNHFLAYHQIFKYLKQNSDISFKLYICEDSYFISDVEKCTENKGSMLYNSLSKLSDIII